MSDSAPILGRTISHYRILEKLGGGGMGVVYRAEDTRLGRQVALKFLPDELSSDRHAADRFKREARAASALNHPNICTIHDIGEHEGRQFLVMELLEGETLKHRMGGRVLATEQVLQLGMQIARALETAHAKGIVHRDIKPANVFVSGQDQVKVLDFGLAKLLRPLSEATLTESLTEQPAVAGTLPYMAPEQLRGEQVDGRADIYALGVVLYEMATGQRPFREELATRLADDILHGTPLLPSRLRPDIPARFEEVTLKCLEKDPENRYQSARELEVDLRRLMSSTAAALPDRAYSGRQRRTGRKHIRSLAVLALANLSRDPDQDYFADGMTEALITDLSKIGALKVISRTSAMRYKGTEKSVPEIACELGVDAIIEGSVVRAGKRVRITAQLINGGTDEHLWAESYERDLGDILSLQSEVARAIAQAIRIKVTAREQTRLASACPVNPEAFQLYLQGRYYWNRRTPEGVKKAVEYMNQALTKDPNYAVAYAGLAGCYSVLGDHLVIPGEEAYTRGMAAAQRALELDATLPEPHAAIGSLREGHDHDWAGAEAELKRAIELNPNYATAHQWYGLLLAHLGRLDEARQQIELARGLDPLSLIIQVNVGEMYEYARQFDRAIEEYRKITEMDPNFVSAHFALAGVYEQKRMYREAAFEWQKGLLLRANDLEGAALYEGITDEASYRRATARRIDLLKEKAETRYVSPMTMANLHARLGDKDQAIAWLEKACQERSTGLVYLKVDPRYDLLRTDPRFQDLLRRIGLSP